MAYGLRKKKKNCTFYLFLMETDIDFLRFYRTSRLTLSFQVGHTEQLLQLLQAGQGEPAHPPDLRPARQHRTVQVAAAREAARELHPAGNEQVL